MYEHRYVCMYVCILLICVKATHGEHAYSTHRWWHAGGGESWCMRALGSRSEVVVVKLHVAGAVEGVVLVHVVLVRRVVQLLVRVIVNVMLVSK